MSVYRLTNNSKIPKNYVDIKKLNKEFYQNLSSKDIVYLQGGDGTLNNFINRLEDKIPKIILEPCGTGNDFSRMLTNDYVKSFYYEINDKKFINGFGMGFDAEVCNMVNKVESKSQLVYLKNVIIGLRNLNSYELDIVIDGKNFKFKNVMLCAVQNGKYFGNGMKITPNANICDEELELCIIHDMSSKLKLVLLFPLVFFGLHKLVKKNVFLKKVKNVSGSSNKLLKAQCEGEVFNVKDFVIKKVSTIDIKKD